MSNVLIGIIGVILFIGLALAGALFLGPRFQEATLNSKASTTVQAVTQVSRAVDLFRLQEGRTVAEARALGPDGLLPGYLKSMPAPAASSNVYYDAIVMTAGRPDATIVASAFNVSPDMNRRLCEIVVRQTSGDSTIPAEPNLQSGCYYNGSTYVVYSRI